MDDKESHTLSERSWEKIEEKHWAGEFKRKVWIWDHLLRKHTVYDGAKMPHKIDTEKAF